MTDESNKPGVSGEQKKNSYVVRQQKQTGKWCVIAPNDSVVASNLSYAEATKKLKELNPQ